VGTAVAARHHDFAPVTALVTLFAALALQVGANFANDLSDFRRGADDERIGPPRVTQLGLLSERDVIRGIWVVFGAAVLAGLYLVYIGGWPIIAIGLASLAAPLAYTGGPWPFGYRGLGGRFAFIFFRVAAGPRSGVPAGAPSGVPPRPSSVPTPPPPPSGCSATSPAGPCSRGSRSRGPPAPRPPCTRASRATRAGSSRRSRRAARGLD